MASGRDSYSNDLSIFSGESYYSNGELFGLREKSINEWEHDHRQCMIDDANRYVSVMPNLRWTCFGQTPMAVTKTDDGSRRVRALSDRQDGCFSLLGTLFGLRSDF